MKIFSPYIRIFLSLILAISLTMGMLLSPFLYGTGSSYIEGNTDSFVYYKQKLQGTLQDMEREFRVNNVITDATLSNVRSLVQEAYNRLPDTGEIASKNDGLKKAVDLYLDLAAKNKTSTTNVQNAISQGTSFLSDATISGIEGSISANPTSGNAPFTSSFLATAKDPSGINIPDNNYIWWTRQSGGYRKEIGRGPSLTYTFSKEGNYQVFLDVMSESRNKKGRPDVIPLTISQEIEVKPRLGNVILLLNGVNVSNIDTMKVSPNLGKIGLLFDATASRAVSNGTIVKTKWDFGNGNTTENDGAPVLERQLYVNPEKYAVSVEITTNQGQTFRKQLQLLVRDPAAVISLDKESGFIGEDIQMSAKSYLANTPNVEYTWDVQDVEGGKKSLTSKVGSTFSYKFTKVGQYLITLTSRSPNGNIDSDSRVFIVESHDPLINLDTPRPLTQEKPNTLLFDASRSYDPDTNNAKGLIYSWMIDGEKVNLNDPLKDGSIGTYTFKEKGTHSVSLTVANIYGKVASVDRSFDVTSTLTVGVNISPRATPIGNTITFQARSPDARFYEWDVGDGSPTINGTADYIQHIYKRTGVYTATLTVKNADGSEENRISRKIYITDTDRPFALIDVRSPNGSVQEDTSACDTPEGAFVVNRAESTTIDGGNSINVDGNLSGLSYTWKYMDRVKTGPSISEKFTELGCFPIELTVRSDKTGASYTSKRYIQIKNIVPKVTSIDAAIDSTKKDTQKLIVKVTANGARDEDGVITSYIWFYTTESDTEKQNIRITQSPTTTFVLPNVTEKYYFGAIVEDNDGARYDSSDAGNTQKPLLIANDDANINMPLISLNVDKTQVLTDELVGFAATAKNIISTDITAKSEYYWDFDGDGRIDQKTAEPQTSYTYKRSGKYNMKLKVVNAGVSNTKYQVIYVKNELKANAVGYKIGDMTYFMNTSRGSYDTTKWTLGSLESANMNEVSIPNALLASSGSLGNLTIKSGANEVSTLPLDRALVTDLVRSESGITFQSYPTIDGDTITLKAPGDTLLIAMHGNSAKEYIIDTDTKIDSDLDAIGDNDKDNKDTPSYGDGSAYLVANLKDSKTRIRTVKLSLIAEDGKIISTKLIQVVLEYIKADTTEVSKDLSGTGTEAFSTADKANLEKLQAKIRTLAPEDRIIFTQYYNTLIDGWGDLHDRTESLLMIQKEVNDSTSLDANTKTELSDIMDVILVGDAQATNDVSIASRVIEGLIATSNPNRAYVIERLEQIKAHPGSLSTNKVLGKEILTKIQDDASISTENKLLIKSQLLTIVNGGQENIPQEEKTVLEQPATGGGILGFIGGIVKIFLIVLAIIAILFLMGYIVYRLSRKSGDMGFQDFLIDSIAHTKNGAKPSNISTSPMPAQATGVSPILIDSLGVSPSIEKSTTPKIDPLASIGVYHEGASPSPSMGSSPSLSAVVSSDVSSPVGESSHSIPDWLKPVQPENKQESPSSESLPKNPLWNKDDSDAIVIKSRTELSLPLSETEDGSPKEDTKEKDILDTPSIDPLDMTGEASDLSLRDEIGEDRKDAEVSDLTDSSDSTPLLPSNEPIDIIPDWLKPPTEIGAIAEPHTIMPEDAEIQEIVPIIPPPNPDAELPDWLKNSVDISEVLPEKEKDNTQEIQEEKEKKPKQKRKAEKKISLPEEKSSKAKVSSSSGSDNDIPDWLR